MLVDNFIYQQPFLSATPPAFPEFSSDLNDIFETELFNNNFGSSSSAPSVTSPESSGSSPSTLTTPPQETLSSFSPGVHDDEAITNSFYNIFEEDLKSMESLPTTAPSFMGIDGSLPSGFSNFGLPYGMSDLANLGLTMPSIEDSPQSHGIDPQLVDTPSAMSDHGDDDSDDKESIPSPVSEKREVDRPTITIAPVKVGGHGKSRKGTVQSGGVVKKTALPLTGSKDKESSVSGSLVAGASKKSAVPKFPKPSTLFQSTSPTPFINAGESYSKANSEIDGDDDDDLPQDWRPSPEVFAKMTSKEKRQLRNKISARNFRIRRKGVYLYLPSDISCD